MRLGEMKPDTTHSRGVESRRGQAATKDKYVFHLGHAQGTR